MSIDELAWGPDGLLPVVIQDAGSGAVLTLAYANREALERTLSEGATYLYSRSRAQLWKKGETSGNTQRVTGVSYDCDADALLYRVVPNGPGCHTGATSCFHRNLTLNAQASSNPDVLADAVARGTERTFTGAATGGIGEEGGAVPAAGADFARAIDHLRRTIAQRREASPETSYTARLLRDGVDKIGKKIGEEATEVVIAAKNGAPAEIAWEVADLFYHTLVLLEERGVGLDEVGRELLRRAE